MGPTWTAVGSPVTIPMGSQRLDRPGRLQLQQLRTQHQHLLQRHHHGSALRAVGARSCRIAATLSTAGIWQTTGTHARPRIRPRRRRRGDRRARRGTGDPPPKARNAARAPRKRESDRPPPDRPQQRGHPLGGLLPAGVAQGAALSGRQGAVDPVLRGAGSRLPARQAS